MNTLQEAILAAEAGRPVWLGELRRRMEQEAEHREARLRLFLLDGGTREFAIPLLAPENGEQRSLLLEYGKAQLFNALSAFSGAGLCLYLPEGEDWQGLGREALAGMREPGYRKALRVADRLCRAEGREPFSAELLPLSGWRPLPEERALPAAPLAPRLRAAVQAAERGFRCGLDVGGTDIKLVLAREGRVLLQEEYDWDPSRFAAAKELMTPILELLRRGIDRAAPGEGALLDSLGLSFPDVVIRDRILGGETPKTRGMRENRAVDYEREFAKLGGLKERLAAFCREGAPIHLLNDGSMAAFSAAVELACAGEDAMIGRGVFAHSLGTDLGSGWLRADGTVPPIPLELYDLLVDLGSRPQRLRSPEDLRSTCNENSGLPGARRYLGQAAAFRLAWEQKSALLEGFTEERDGVLQIRREPEDLRKPCLEHLMRLAERGDPDAEAVFRRIGANLGQLSREIAFLLAPETEDRFLFGRFVRHPRCFALLREGCAEASEGLRLIAADEELAVSPLMRQLADRGGGAVARFGQAAGAVYYGLYAGEEST